MPLPHFTQLLNTGSPGGPGTLPDEVVYLNLFEVTFVLPVILQAQGRNPILLLQNALKAWYDLVFNSQNGSLHYKSDIIGTVIVNQHDKKGVVLRRVTYQNVQIKQLQGYSLDWSSNNIIESTQADFIYDYFIDEYIDNNFTINPPLVSGY